MIGTPTNITTPAVEAMSGPSITGPIWRLLAGLIDVIALMILIGLVEAFIPHSMNIAANLFVTLAYYLLMLILFSGTVGQMICGDIVTTEDGGHPTVWTAIRRSLWITVSYILCGLPFVTMFFTKRHQTLHDLVAHTIVIRKRSS